MHAGSRKTPDGRRFAGSFLRYIREHQLGKKDGRLQRRAGVGYKRTAVGVRYAYEMLDLYIGQYCSMMFPHLNQDTFVYPFAEKVVNFTKFYLSALSYLRHLVYRTPSSERFPRDDWLRGAEK